MVRNNKKKMKDLEILAVGDIMLGGRVGEVIERMGDEFVFGGIKRKFNDEHSIKFANLEMMFSSNGAIKLPHVVDEYRVYPSRINSLKYLNIDIVNIGTNHIKDFGNEAIKNTIIKLNSSGISHIGGGMNEHESREPFIIRKSGIRIGFLGYCKIGEYSATAKNTGAAPLIPEKIYQDITSIKKNVDFVILSLHWGTELSEYPSPEQVKMAHNFCDRGANIIIGHHPHVVQGVEEYKNSLIFYSLGNFIFDNYAGNLVYKGLIKERSEGIVAKIKLNKEKKINWKLIPTYVSEKLTLKEAKGEKKESILNRIKRSSHVISSGKLKSHFYSTGIDHILKREIETYIIRLKKEKLSFVAWILKNFKLRYVKLLLYFLLSKIKKQLK